jgi:ADP-heptose:LPS heptosyltransferase
MNLKKKNLIISPQGIGDLAIPLKYFYINFLKNINYENYFIIQYKEQIDILKKHNKTKIEFFFSNIFYKLSFSNLYKIYSLSRIFYDKIYIDPNIKIFKAIFLSLIFKSKYKFYRKFFLSNLFFNFNINYTSKIRKRYYEKLSKLEFKKKTDNSYFKILNPNSDIIGIAPETGKLELHRRWEMLKFIKLVNNLKIKINKIYIFGIEKKNLEYFQSQIIYNSKIISFKNINNSLRHLKKIKLLISNDNGIANFAANFGIKCKIICGPSIPHPIKNYKNVDIITKNLKCSPCYHKNRFGCGSPICLTKLDYESVIKKI